MVCFRRLLRSPTVLDDLAAVSATEVFALASIGAINTCITQQNLLLYSHAEVVELADAPDSKSGRVHPLCGFDSRLRHSLFSPLQPFSFLTDMKLV